MRFHLLLSFIYGSAVLAAPKGYDDYDDTYDFIVVGAGAAGLVVADRLSETGKKVLLVERGPPSTWDHGGRNGPQWTLANQLTRYDVPGLCNQIWVDSAGIACTDNDQVAGCLLGGGTAINAGLFFKPADRDFDPFPSGWKANDMKSAVSKVFNRIPSTDTPSQDGKRHQQELFVVLSQALGKSGWKEVKANASPNDRQKTYAHSPFMFIGGERGGPLATYLVSAKARRNFKLAVNTTVERVVRDGKTATGIEVVPFGANGLSGKINLSKKGKIVLSAGAFGSAKLLLRSGIGPKDQLKVVKASSDGPKLVKEKDWIELPVGKNLIDHADTDLVVSHPSLHNYDWIGGFNNPVPADRDEYLKKRSGVLAQAAPAVNMAFWESFKGKDGKTRGFQWSARGEGSVGQDGLTYITLASNLGYGLNSAGRTTIDANLTMRVTDEPWIKTEADFDAIVQAVDSMLKILKSSNNGIQPVVPPSFDYDAKKYVQEYTQSRRTNHWMGTARMGPNNGQNVVDADTKVYGTENLFVVDASIFPGMTSHNPTATILTVAERAVERILRLK